MSGPLQGVKVLDLSAVVAGPLAAALLADQGAEVIKVERIGSGDIQRHVGSSRNGFSGFFHMLNRGKKSIALDFSKSEAVDIVCKLAAEADVVIQNFRPGVVDRLGVGYEQLKQHNPGIIYLSISGFGPDGPQAKKRAYDPIIQTYSGIAHVQGLKRGEGPEQVNQLIMDKLTAHHGCQSISAALYYRTQSGKGQHITLSMLDTAAAFLWPDAGADNILQGKNIDHRPAIGGSGQLMEYRDGWGAIMILSDSEFEGLCQAFELPELASDERFNSLAARMNHRLEYQQMMAGVVSQAAAQLSLEEAEQRLSDCGVPFARLRQLADLPEDPQAIHNQIFQTIDHPTAGLLRETRPAPRFSESPAEPAGYAPTVGEHTAEILATIGLEAELTDLVNRGIVGI
jgi:crotonobetainyl-CoA:carnitine CoA-transferase CaiB-like acyl-CoA transferase